MLICYRHAGYAYSGPTTAWAYKAIQSTDIKRVFILGPSHHAYLSGCALTKMNEYATPLGNLIVDVQTNAELAKTNQFTTMSTSTDEEEHSLEMHLPYVYHTFGPTIPIIPILVGALTPAKEQHYGQLLVSYIMDPHTAIVISSDFCHWGRRFGYTYYQAPQSKPIQLTASSTTTIPIHESIRALDHQGMDLITAGSHDAFCEYLSQTGNTICGRHPIGVVLAALKIDPTLHFEFLRYAQSSAVMRPSDSSVSYASAVAHS